VLVNRLCEGQRATVLQLPAVPHAAREPNKRTSGSVTTTSAR
jgi:hypothetical protein